MAKPKIFIVFVLLYVSFFSVNAQSYRPFPDSAKWRVSACGGISDYPWSCIHRDYYTSGDTTIGAYTYKKVYLSNYSVQNRIAAGIRNDIPAKKIYGIYFLNLRSDENFNSPCLDFSFYNIDTLLCDFSKIDGDSMELFFLGDGGCSGPSDSLKDEVNESTYEYNNIQLRKLQFRLPSLTFYEGIGCNEGIFELSISILGRKYLFEEKARGLYFFTDFSNEQEFIFLSTEKGENKVFSSLIPNPVASSATLQLGTYIEAGTFTIEDIRGTTMLQQSVAAVKEIPINAMGMAPGIYFWRLTDENGRQYGGKMIVE